MKPIDSSNVMLFDKISIDRRLTTNKMHLWDLLLLVELFSTPNTGHHFFHNAITASLRSSISAPIVISDFKS